jgi:Icc protein
LIQKSSLLQAGRVTGYIAFVKRGIMILAQQTDLHVKPAGRLAYRQADTAACLQAAVCDVLNLPVRPDAVLVTGDLTDAGLPEEYAFLRELLAPLPMPVFLMPGNHDVRANLRAVFPDHAYLGSGDGPVNYTIEDFPVRIIAPLSNFEWATSPRTLPKAGFHCSA